MNEFSRSAGEGREAAPMLNVAAALDRLYREPPPSPATKAIGDPTTSGEAPATDDETPPIGEIPAEDTRVDTKPVAPDTPQTAPELGAEPAPPLAENPDAEGEKTISARALPSCGFRATWARTPSAIAP